jgi:anti-sigma B factor antagonist
LPRDPSGPESGVFRLRPQHRGRDAAWIRLSGELDLATAAQFAARLNDALSAARLVVVDLRQLTFMDSTGLSVLVTAQHRARRSGRRLVLIRGPRQVDRLLKLIGFADRLEITDLQSLQSPKLSDRVTVRHSMSARPLNTPGQPAWQQSEPRTGQCR